MNNHHKLSIRLVPGGFCFSNSRDSLLGNTKSTFISVAPGPNYCERLEEAMLDAELNNCEDDVECVVETTRFSLSPTVADDAEAVQMYNLTLRETEEKELILHDVCESIGVRISFAINKDLHSFMLRTFQYITFGHHLTAILDKEASRKSNTPNWLTARVDSGTLTIVAFKDNALQVANCLKETPVSNQVYHILNTWSKLELDVLTDTLYIIGNEGDCQKLKSAISKFIKQCE